MIREVLPTTGGEIWKMCGPLECLPTKEHAATAKTVSCGDSTLRGRALPRPSARTRLRPALLVAR